MSKRLFAILVVVCACIAMPVASALSRSAPRVVSHPFVTGIADQTMGMYTDPRFLNLKITHTRIYLPWDLLTNQTELTESDAWLQAAHKLNIDVLVTISQSRNNGKHGVNPTPAQMVSALKAWRKRWPFLHEFSTFNEVNLLQKNPAMVAKWWMALTKACPTCTILGADLVDRTPATTAVAGKPSAIAKNISTWVKGFLKATKGKQPKVWGFHDYNDVNLKRTSGTAAMLKAVKGQVWLDETGGLVGRKNASPVKLPEGVSHAANADKFLLTKLAVMNPRIKRVYIFDWTDSSPVFDSALTGPKNETRPSLTFLTQFLTGSSTVPSPVPPSKRK